MGQRDHPSKKKRLGCANDLRGAIPVSIGGYTGIVVNLLDEPVLEPTASIALAALFPLNMVEEVVVNVHLAQK